MKENYIYSNGKILVTDFNEYGLKRIEEREYQDNIEDIFKVENIIEELENNKITLKESIRLKNLDIKRNKKNNLLCILATIIATITASVIAACSSHIIAATGIYIHIGLLMGISASCISFPFISNNLKINKQLKKEINGNKLTLKKVIEQLNQNNDVLTKLKANKSKENEVKVQKTKKLIRINYLENLKQLKKYLALYGEIGVKEKEFNNYYKQGILDEKLNSYFNPDEIEEIKTYFKKRK